MLLGVKWQTDGGALPIINLLHAGMSLAQKFAFFHMKSQLYITVEHWVHFGSNTNRLYIFNIDFIFETEFESFKIFASMSLPQCGTKCSVMVFV